VTAPLALGCDSVESEASDEAPASENTLVPDEANGEDAPPRHNQSSYGQQAMLPQRAEGGALFSDSLDWPLLCVIEPESPLMGNVAAPIRHERAEDCRLSSRAWIARPGSATQRIRGEQLTTTENRGCVPGTLVAAARCDDVT